LELSDEGDGGERAELGFADKDEGRTLTARSKSRPNPKFSSSLSVPALPQSRLGKPLSEFRNIFLLLFISTYL